MKSSDSVDRDLKACGLRATPQRLAVLAAAAGADGYFTPQELHEILKERRTVVGLTTVYRALEVLERTGLICRIENAGDERYYTYCSRVHHHHLVCDGCAQVVELDDCGLSSLVGKLEQDTGFSIHGHSLEFHGMCPACGHKVTGRPKRIV